MSESAVAVETNSDVGCEYSNPIKALGHMFRHLFDFSGRATRKEFFMSMVGFAVLWGASLWCSVALGFGDQLAVCWLFGVPCLTSLMMRRYHDCQIKSGTGYAALEIFSIAGGKTLRRAIWERYKPIDSTRIVLRPATNGVKSARSAGEETCWLGHPEIYLSEDLKKVEQGLQELKETGWVFH